MKVFYDLDGTLLDSKGEIVYTIEKALEENGFSLADAIHPIRIGPPLKQILLNSYPEGFFSEEDLAKINRSMRRIYDSSDYHMTPPYPGVVELLATTPYESYVLTNKPHSATDRIVEIKGWSKYFKGIFVPDSSKGESKETILRDLKKQFPNETIVMVGDTISDTGSAQKAGVKAVGVLWGEGTKEELLPTEPDYCVSSLDDLKRALIELAR
ncbi:MAG: HAD family hydrolase [Bacilli bacterium]|nr:HAD family hydrolase [Bacilli bacterium]